ncbi:MAG: extracellular solute-binding protein, partial [Firmicutes bacterium]|nr:extracellular solute-binding protein [Bacillota bacterium]
MKKFLSLMLAFALVFGLASVPTAEDFDPTAVKGEISFWTAWTPDRGVANWIAEFNEISPNIIVTPVQYSNSVDGNLKLNASLLTSDVDVALNYNYANTMQRVTSGLFRNLNDYTEADGTDFIAEWGLDTSFEGSHFILPVGGNTDKVFVNLDMVEAAGLTLPESWTLDEYIEFARKLTSGTGVDKVYGTSDMHAGQIYWGRMARGVLGNNYYYNAEGLSNFDNPMFEKALAFKYNMEEVEKIQYPYLEYKASGAQVPDVFVSGKVAMCVCTGMMARWLKDIELYPRDFKVAVMPMPSLEDGAANYNDGVYYFSFLGVGANSANPDAAYLFAKWFATEGS